MSTFVLSFRGRSDRTASAEEEAAWGQWFQEIGGSVADFGHRVGRVTALGSAASSGTGSDVLTGYVLINADDLEGRSRWPRAARACSTMAAWKSARPSRCSAAGSGRAGDTSAEGDDVSPGPHGCGPS